MKPADKKKQNEPFKPEETPTPPQVQDPNLRNERNEPNARIEENRERDRGKKTEDTGRRLGESPLEIDDETTI
jgi:hypothetical protein